MNRQTWLRQSHRWLGVVFTATVLISIVAVSQETPPMWVFYLPLPPLGLQLLTGLYLFAVPYVTKRRSKSGDIAQA